MYIEGCLCGTLLDHSCDAGHEQSLFALRKHAPSGVVHGTGTTDGDGRDLGLPRKPTLRPRLEQRRGVAAGTAVELGEKVVQHLSVQGGMHEGTGDSTAAAVAVAERAGQEWRPK